MAKRLVKKAATAVVETEEAVHPEVSPTGADFVFMDSEGVAHYEDGSRWVPEEDEVELVTPEDEEQLPEDEATDEEDEEGDEEEAPDPEVEKGLGHTVAHSKGKKKKRGYPDEEKVTKAVSDPALVGLDALRLSTALVEKVQEIFTATELSKREEAYENAMLDFNRVMDTAALQNWLAGSSVSKRDDTEAVDVAVEAITKTYTTVVENVGGTPVSKSDDKVDIYKGLTPEAADIVKRSADVLEQNEVAKWEGVAKGFKNVPGDKSALGAALRALSEADPEKYKAVEEALGAADEGLKDSSVFKSFGTPGTDTPTGVAALAQELVSKGEAKTLDEAELLLMERNPGEFYKSTNA